jgi:hypothetical protein
METVTHTIILDGRKTALGDVPIGSFFEYDSYVWIRAAAQRGSSVPVVCLTRPGLPRRKGLTDLAHGLKVVPIRKIEIRAEK